MNVRASAPGRAAGFFLLGTVLLAFVLAGVLAAAARAWEANAQRERERELLWIGKQFRRALQAYAAATPPGTEPAPRGLEELLRDARYQPPRRHLRKLFVDPMTGRAEWGLERSASGGIEGVHSLSHRRPMKPDGLWPEEHAFAAATRYSEWVFRPAPVVRFPSRIPAQGGDGDGPGSAPVHGDD